MDQSKTFYDVLEISESASRDEIKAAHRRLITEYHPDKIPEHLTRLRRDAEERTLKLQDAWRTLGDPVSRRLYDETLRVLRAATPPKLATEPAPPAKPAPARVSVAKAVLICVAAAAFVWLAFVAVLLLIERPSRPFPSGTRLLTDELRGSTIGDAHGIRWTLTGPDRGAVFSAQNSSRIEYPTQVPAEGTLEMWIKIKSGHRRNLGQAVIFSTGAAMWSVSRRGDVSFRMARHRGNWFAPEPTEALHTRFRYNEWHALGVSYGAWGQYLMVDGEVVASNPQQAQRMGSAGTNQAPEIGGFEGIVAGVRISPKQQDWQLARGIVYGDGIAPDTGAYRSRVCSGTDIYLDMAHEQTEQFTVQLSAGCFSGYVLIPETWKRYRMEAVEPGEGWWLAYRWYPKNSRSGERAPLTAKELSSLAPHTSQRIRIQGNGRLLFRRLY